LQFAERDRNTFYSVKTVRAACNYFASILCDDVEAKSVKSRQLPFCDSHTP